MKLIINRKTIIFLLVISILACQETSTFEMDQNFDPEREIAEHVEMIYSDSAQLKFIIRTPRLEKYFEKKDVLVEQFPKGIQIDFYGPNKQIKSSLSAKYAERRSSKGTMLLRDSVVLNNGNDQLKTIGILWNEQNQTLKTAKFIQMIQGQSKDTLWGYGLEARDDFSKFKIRKLTGKRSYEDPEAQ